MLDTSARFAFNDDHAMFRDTVRQVFAKELVPNLDKFEEEGIVSIDGAKFHYEEDDTWAALYYDENATDHSQVRMMEFSSGGKKSLTVELWEDEGAKPDKEAFLSEVIKPSAVKVLQAGIASEVS